MNRTDPVIQAAVEAGVCRHCTRTASLCVDCARCESCGHSPNCEPPVQADQD